MGADVAAVVCGALLSLSIFGLSNDAIDHITEKCPWEKEKTRTAVFIIIIIITGIILYYSHQKKKAWKKQLAAHIKGNATVKSQ